MQKAFFLYLTTEFIFYRFMQAMITALTLSPIHAIHVIHSCWDLRTVIWRLWIPGKLSESNIGRNAQTDSRYVVPWHYIITYHFS